MRRHLPARFAAIAAMVAAGSLGSVGFFATGVAGASAPTVTCTGFSANITGTGKLTGCNDTANTGGKGTIKTNITKSTTVVTWNGTGTTTSKYTDKAVTPNKCKSPGIEIKETSTTTGGTGKALKSIPKGQVATLLVCENTKAKTVTLLPGQKIKV